MQRSRSLGGRLTRYGIVGLATNLAAYVLFLGLLYGGVDPVLASGITYLAAVVASYLANRSWSFRSITSHARDVPRYLVAYGAGLGAAMGLMYVLSAWMPPEIAQLLVIGFTALVIFTLLELMKFGE